ncbi:hypothetical protein AB0F72_17190 [Actinoplanes sp. NPDC023936]|uniref:hypothetical protein n=1 Tax=Actinoplanes sp. NPDC023936 TaxID=3154910 RepID=UPI0033E40359
MPLHIGSLTTDITVVDGELPLSERQVCQIAAAVVRLLEVRDRDARRQQEATRIRRSVQPPSPIAGD